MGVAVKVAQVPVVYQVPLLMIQPFCWPPLVTNKVPLPEKDVPGVLVGVLPTLLVVVGRGEGRLPVLGKYFIPVAGQLELAPAEAKFSPAQIPEATRHQMAYLDWQEYMNHRGRSLAHRKNTRSHPIRRSCI